MKNNYEFSINSELCITNNNDKLYKSIIKFLNKKLISNVIIITGPHLNKLGIAERIKENIENEKITVRMIYCDIPQDGKKEIIEEIVNLGNLNNCNGYIAVGGGSVLDIAKGVKAAYKCDDINLGSGGYDYIKKNKNRNVSLICIPTTAGTGSELTKVIVIKNEQTNRKDEIISDELLPDLSILTDEFIKTLPQKTTFTTMIDALTHAIEAMTSIENNYLSDSYAEESIKLIINNIDEIINNPNDSILRIKSLIASAMAGIAFSNSMVGLVHAIAHSLGAVLHIPHDLACALMLSDVMEFNKGYDNCVYEKILNIIKIESNNRYQDTDNSITIIKKILNKYFAIFNISYNLKDYGLNLNNINEIVNKAYYDGARLTNCRPVKKVDIYNLLNKRLKE